MVNNMVKITVLSQFLFDERMKGDNLDDSRIDARNDLALISIIGTRECLEYYLDEGNTRHWFQDGHDNVLNLDFDDLDEDIVYKGHTFKTISMDQAMQAVDFIDKAMANDELKEIVIHCRAGMSRSRAFAEYVYRTYHDKVEYDEQDQFTTLLNHGVLRKLLRCKMAKDGLIDKEDD